MAFRRLMWRKGLILLLLWLPALAAHRLQAQKSLHLSVVPLAQGKPLALGDTLRLDDKAYAVLETLRFYISGISLFRGDSLVWQEPASYHLYDLSESALINLTIPAGLCYDAIRFCTGIDSLTHEAGAMGGDLDPTKGMYWTWQSGYINFKIEGYSNLCANPKHYFQIHLGGYKMPYPTLQEHRFMVSAGGKVQVCFDVLAFLRKAGLERQVQVMSPGAEALKLSELLGACFQLRS